MIATTSTSEQADLARPAGAQHLTGYDDPGSRRTAGQLHLLPRCFLENSWPIFNRSRLAYVLWVIG